MAKASPIYTTLLLHLPDTLDDALAFVAHRLSVAQRRDVSVEAVILSILDDWQAQQPPPPPVLPEEGLFPTAHCAPPPVPSETKEPAPRGKYRLARDRRDVAAYQQKKERR